MVRLNKQTDYGILLLVHLASAIRKEVYTARELAEELGIPLPMVSKTLKLLAQHGLLVSQRGVQGGYQLARRPEAISLAEVIHALEEGVAMTECLWAPGDCEQEPTCRVRRNWHRINQVVQGALETISLLDMTHPLPEHLIPLTRISLSN